MSCSWGRRQGEYVGMKYLHIRGLGYWTGWSGPAQYYRLMATLYWPSVTTQGLSGDGLNNVLRASSCYTGAKAVHDVARGLGLNLVVRKVSRCSDGWSRAADTLSKSDLLGLQVQ